MGRYFLITLGVELLSSLKFDGNISMMQRKLCLDVRMSITKGGGKRHT